MSVNPAKARFYGSIFLLFFLVWFAAGAWVRNPAGCVKLGDAAYALVISLLPASLQPDPAPPISAYLQGRLISANGSSSASAANTDASSLQYVALYYSAQWYPPCRVFTPALVEWYKKFKPGHPRFELVFVSEDYTEDGMLDGMKAAAMPWPAVRFGDLRHGGAFPGPGIQKFAGEAIPDLVLVDGDGKVLADSFTPTGAYLGPQHVLGEMETIIDPGRFPSASTSALADSSLAFLPQKMWVPPAAMPAQPNWTWKTVDGKTYENVVVTGIEPDAVTISHSLGVAHISTDLLPPDIQKMVNYDPEAAASVRAENQRELAHPYYSFADRADAQEVAHQLHWPLAWIDSYASCMTANPQNNSAADLTQMARDDLKSQAVVIFVDNTVSLDSVPPLVRDQLFIMDDGPLPGGHHFYAPKIVISDPDVNRIFGRVSFTQMKAGRQLAINEVLATIGKDTTPAPTPASATTALAPAASPATAPSSTNAVPSPPAPAIAPAAAPSAATGAAPVSAPAPPPAP